MEWKGFLRRFCFEGRQEEIAQRVQWFKKNPDDTRLDNHELTKKMAGQWRLSVRHVTVLLR